MANKTQRFLFLDGLRAIAALMVMFHHFYKLLKPLIQFSCLDIVFDSTRLGVQIFFVLSGFVIAFSIRDLPLSFSSACRFLIRRSIRLDPPFWVALTLTLLIPIITSSYQVDYATICANAFYLQDFLGYDRPLAVSWTLCIELQFYVFFIFFLTFTRKTSNEFRLCIFFFLYVLSLAQNKFNFLHVPGLFTFHWYSFSTGCMAAWLYLKNLNEKAFLACMLMMIPLLKDPFILATLVAISSIFFAIKCNSLYSWLSSSFFQYFGKRSYSIYLIHWVIGVKFIDIAMRRFPFFDPYSLFLIATILTLIGSELFYRKVEKPFLLLSKITHVMQLDKKH